MTKKFLKLLCFSSDQSNTCKSDLHSLYVGRGVETTDFPAAPFTLKTFNVYSRPGDAPSPDEGTTRFHQLYPVL